MEYGETVASAGYGNQLASAARPADLSALCQQLERHIERAREASFRIRDHADRIFGSRPEPANSIAQVTPAPTLANLIDLLGEQLAAIESGLARL